MLFEEYLHSKKIDAEAFSKAESALYRTWKKEFEQMHPNSFTVQKLNLINPTRRKYPLKEVPSPAPVVNEPPRTSTPVSSKPGKPVMKPKLK